MSKRGGKVYFVGAGPGDPELLTLKGKRIIQQADVVVYADSLVDRSICDFARTDAEVHTSSSLTLEQILDIMVLAARDGRTVARIHTGDPSIFGAIHEQMAALEEREVEYEIVPGVSSIFGAAAAVRAELTVPEVSQTVIITRLEGRTPVPEKQRLRDLAAHDATMALFLSVGMIEQVVAELLEGGYKPSTPAAVVYRATWKDERRIVSTLADIVGQVHESGIERQALILVGDSLGPRPSASLEHRSKLYDKNFDHGYRKSTE